MKNRTLSVLASAVLAFGFVTAAQAHTPVHQHHAHSGDWATSGWVQWHPQAGRTQLAAVGTQTYFKHDSCHVAIFPHSQWHCCDAHHGHVNVQGSCPANAK